MAQHQFGEWMEVKKVRSWARENLMGPADLLVWGGNSLVVL